MWGNIYVKARNTLAVERAGKLVYIRANGRKYAVSSSEMQEELLMDVLSEERGDFSE